MSTQTSAESVIALNSSDHAGDISDRPLRVAIVGNPNTGKTTLFNALTGLRQRVGNFAGVTVERVEGSFRMDDGRRVSVLDLPGSYSLSAGSPDEQIALEVLLKRDSGHWLPDVVLVVVDANHMERNLFLTSQIMELGIPVVVALNQIDIAEAEGVDINVPDLISELGVIVVPTVARRSEGVDVVKRALFTAASLPAPERRFVLPDAVRETLAPLQELLEEHGLNANAAAMESLRLVGIDHIEAHLHNVPGLQQTVASVVHNLAKAGFIPGRYEADVRYAWIHGVTDRTITRRTERELTLSDRIDRVVLHRVMGPIVFLVLMAIVFQSVFTWAEPVMDFVEGGIASIGELIRNFIPEGDLQSLLVDGVIAGVGAVLVFLPQIAVLFIFIGILEHTGYMARAAYLMDRIMRKVGLQGKSFIPMLSGYACAVPGIMATRTIEDRRDRLTTIMVVPLMSCSARLPVYTLLIGAFVPPIALFAGINLQGFTMLVMYLLGTVTALIIAAFFRRTLLKGPVRPMILELPPYRWPSMHSLGVSVWQRCLMFVQRAGTVILSLTIVLWALATWPRSDIPDSVPEEMRQEMQLEHSFLGRMGKAVEPAVRPLGYDWKIGVSIVASFAAREVFVSTMGTIYGVGDPEETGDRALREKLIAERNPVTGATVYTPLVAVNLMVFYVFALMCISTVAITVRETGGGKTGWGWAGLQFGYMLVLAYGSAWLVYRIGLAMNWGTG